MKGLKSRTPGYVRAAVDRRRRQQKYTGDLLRSDRHDAEKLLLRGLKGIFHECTVSIGQEGSRITRRQSLQATG